MAMINILSKAILLYILNDLLNFFIHPTVVTKTVWLQTILHTHPLHVEISTKVVGIS